MLGLILRVVLSALAFVYVLPMIDGIQFHGNFVEAIGIGAFFAIMLFVVQKVAAWLSVFFALGTLGVGVLLLIPLWIVGYWVLPAIALQGVAGVMPDYLSVSGFFPAFWGGLVLLVVTGLTGGFSVKVKSDRTNQ